MYTLHPQRLTHKTNAFGDSYVKFVPQTMSCHVLRQRALQIQKDLLDHVQPECFCLSIARIPITVDDGKGAMVQLYLKRWFSFKEMLNLRRDSSWFMCSIMILTPTLQMHFGWKNSGTKWTSCPATRWTADSVQSHVDVPIRPQHPRHWENPTKRWLATVDQPSRRAWWPLEVS